VTITACPREQDVLDALVAERWPDRTDESLRRHVAECSLCADVIEVARPILEDREYATTMSEEEARIPSSAVMWWRAQLRARQEAAREAARPITVAQIIGLVTVVALGISVLSALSPWLRAWLPGLPRLSDISQIDIPGVQVATEFLAQGWLLPSLIVGVWLILTPLAIYFAVADD
jgi:hypothetical protein